MSMSTYFRLIENASYRLDPFIFELSIGHFNGFITYSIQEILDGFGRIPVYNLNTSKSVLGK